MSAQIRIKPSATPSGIGEHICGWNADQFQSQLTHVSISMFITLCDRGKVVHASIHFDDELGSRAIKVRDIGPNRVLAAKSKP